MEPQARGAAEPEKIEVDRSVYETVTDEAALDRWIAEATAPGWSRSTPRPTASTASRQTGRDQPRHRPNSACYIPLEHGGDDLFRDAPIQLPTALVLAKLKPLLEDPAVLKIGHNLKYDWIVFDRPGSTSRRSTTRW